MPNKNPYDEGTPAPVAPRASHPHMSPGTRPSSRPRSRTIQSARDAASQVEGRNGVAGEMETGAARIVPVEPGATRNGSTAQNRAGRIGSYEAARAYKRKKLMLVAAAVLLVFAAGAGIFAWLNRSVTVTVNGMSTEVPVNSKLEVAMDKQGIITNPGNYVTVSGLVVEPNAGYAFSASINGEPLPPDEVDDYRITGNEAISFSDGEDRIEEYTATTETIKPYLRMEGSGYSLQYVSQWAEEGVLEHRTGKESGEKADVVTKEAKDCIITCRDLELEGDDKCVALTFDDGPADPYTKQYLEILDKYGVKATFFNLGDNIKAYPDIAKSVVEAGHQIANHTMAHDQLTADDAQTIYEQITKSAKVLEDATGIATSHIRPPYGDFTERSWLASRGAITASIRWTGDSQDWRLPGADAIVDNSLLNVHSGSIILMHDGGGDRSQDVEALPKLIKRLQDEGYEFVTISDLMRRAGDIPEDICSGTGVMPEGAVWPDEIAPEDIAASQS